MKLQVYVLEARGLSLCNPYVILKFGATKLRTSVAQKSVNPSWNADFYFNVVDLLGELTISVWDADNFIDDFIGQVKVSIADVFYAHKLTILPSWYKLCKQKNKCKSRASGTGTSTGEIQLSFSLMLNATSTTGSENASPRHSNASPLHSVGSSSPEVLLSSGLSAGKKKKLRQKFRAIFKKPRDSASFEEVDENNIEDDYTGTGTGTGSGSGSSTDVDNVVPLSFFDEDSKISVVPSEADEDFVWTLSGGVLLDETYATTFRSLNSLLFRPSSTFLQELFSLQKTTELSEGAWEFHQQRPRRILTYMKASSLTKPVKATEEQTYLRADEKGFVVFVSVSTPDVVTGNNFRIELQFCILPAGIDKCHLSVSWRINFFHSNMMNYAVEHGARKGLRESYKEYGVVVLRFVRKAEEVKEVKEVKEEEEDIKRVINESKSDWQLAIDYFSDPMVILTMVLTFVTLGHILSTMPSVKEGPQFLFTDVDLPDSFSELLVAAVLTIQLKNIYDKAGRFLRARVCVVGDHGVKAKGEGWLVTVVLVEAENLPQAQNSTCLDPYAIFTCSGKVKTSSVRLETNHPVWKEVFEFDATAEPPSTLEVEVFNYDGPFAEAESLGYAEINFLKLNTNNLSDIWVNLRGKQAQASSSRLHLRVFLMNTKGSPDDFSHYLRKLQKEVGSKIVKASSHKNASFQKLFTLPVEEFLVNDFACAVKRKIPLQGRLFLSPRLLGFYSNIFGHKTKLSILWEDIENIEERPPSLASVGPSLLIFTRKGRAHDAGVGANEIDSQGRLKFRFQSFVRPGLAFRTVQVLWKNRALTPEQQIQMIETDGEGGVDENGDFIGVEDVPLKQVFSTQLPFTARRMLMLYERENIEKKVLEKVGCINYSATAWENVNSQIHLQHRQVRYTIVNSKLCQLASRVTCIQQKETSEEMKQVTISEILTLHDVPYGDHFQVQVRKEIETMKEKPTTVGRCKVYVGVVWQKGTMLQTRITTNVFQHYTKHLKEILELVEKEIISLKYK